jgi:hypothetical protein
MELESVRYGYILTHTHIYTHVNAMKSRIVYRDKRKFFSNDLSLLLVPSLTPADRDSDGF